MNVFFVCAPSYCKSAGTLIALGAHHLLVDMFSDLGPLDVQLFKQNEIAARKSGLLSRASFEALADTAFELYERLMIGITVRSGGMVSFKLASELSATMASNLLSPVYAQINPDIVGSENRDLDVAFAYGERLIEYSENASLDSVYDLVHNYPSHDFIIDDDELRKLFHSVDVPSRNLYVVIRHFGPIVYDESSPSIVFGITERPQKEGHTSSAEVTDEENPKTTDGSSEPGSADAVVVDREPDRASDPGPPTEARTAGEPPADNAPEITVPKGGRPQRGQRGTDGLTERK